ncbi:DUF2867 domain-containing protein, partial [uncultured Bradyrhizobium sp.]|uniref:DUF2867 domain-containing protein n=1 Tax=uncultured Bradyrhizobium sp. TaxID=199684 RepID=UPI002626A4DC
MKVDEVTPNVDSAALLAGAQFVDAFRIATTDAGLDARHAAEAMVTRQPRWIEWLLALRNLLVAPLGLKTSGATEGVARDMIGIFPVVSETPQRLVAGFNDKHLDFRLVVDVAPDGPARSITATTIKDGTAYAIRDLSGTLGLIENSGAIGATGADPAATRNVAIDLSARSGDSIVRQTVVAAGVTAPTITGDIRFGSGSDLLELLDGGFAGNVSFGAGTNRLVMSGDAVMIGNADFGGGAGSLSLAGTAAFAGKLLNAQNVAVSVGSGRLAVNGPSTIANLDVGTNGVIGATLGGAAGTSTAITVTGGASFGTGTKIAIRLADINSAVGTYTVISAGSLTGASNLTADSALVPFLYKAALAVTGNNVNVAISRKANNELGLNASEAAAFDSLFAAFGKDQKVADLFLGINNAEVFQAYVAQTLPDHAGGSFEGLSQGLRAFDRHFMDPSAPFDEEGKFRIIADFANWNVEKDRGQSAAFDLSGLGFRGGAEYLTSLGAFGVTGSWLWNKYKNGPFDNSVLSDSYEVGAHWRGKFGPVIAFARGGAGKADFSGSRLFAGSGTNAANYT